MARLSPVVKASESFSASPIIAVVGSLTKDMIFETERMPNLGESVAGLSLQTMQGGKGANIAVAAHRASHKKPLPDTDVRDLPDKGDQKDDEIRVFMNGAVGDDEIGAPLKAGLDEKGVDVSGVLILEGEKTGQVVVIVEEGSRDSRSLGFKGANMAFQPRDAYDVTCLTGDSRRKPDILITHCTLRIETVEQMLENASRNDVETVLSASPSTYISSETWAHVTHLVFNEHEAAEMSDRHPKEFEDIEIAMQTAERFVAYGVKYVVITLGGAGAVYATHNEERGHVQAEKKVRVKDTTGAGDSFLGAYAVDYIRQKQKGNQVNIRQAVVFACKAAARTIEQMGSQTALPWYDEIERKE